MWEWCSVFIICLNHTCQWHKMWTLGSSTPAGFHIYLKSLKLLVSNRTDWESRCETLFLFFVNGHTLCTHLHSSIKECRKTSGGGIPPKKHRHLIPEVQCERLVFLCCYGAFIQSAAGSFAATFLSLCSVFCSAEAADISCYQLIRQLYRAVYLNRKWQVIC